MNLTEPARKNFERLSSNPYPGRGIVIGKAPAGDEFVQVYWIMGRSMNSRNRIFVQEPNGFVRTEVFDRSQSFDPALTIYYALKHVEGSHVVTNGHQTDTIAEALRQGRTFESGLDQWQFEPDPPNYTPRISGLVQVADGKASYRLSILKCLANDPGHPVRQHFLYGSAVDGCGHLVTTYDGDGDPLPSFSGEPALVPLPSGIDRIAEEYWQALNPENRVALCVKTINARDNSSAVRIINKSR